MSQAQPRITMYTRPWCGTSMRVKRWFDEREIPYVEIDISRNLALARTVEELNAGYQSVPTILLDGVHVATEPSNLELEQLFGNL